MRTEALPIITVSFAVDIELEYNPFDGRTKEDIAVALQDQVQDLLYEATPSVQAVSSSITFISTND